MNDALVDRLVGICKLVLMECLPRLFDVTQRDRVGMEYLQAYSLLNDIKQDQNACEEYNVNSRFCVGESLRLLAAECGVVYKGKQRCSHG